MSGRSWETIVASLLLADCAFLSRSQALGIQALNNEDCGGMDVIPSVSSVLSLSVLLAPY